MIRLFVNGVWRKVIIDDKLPASKSGQLLCSFSNDRSELWVSLIEKAYLKVVFRLTAAAEGPTCISTG